MADFEIEGESLETFIRELANLEEQFPKEAKQLMRKAGTKARTIVSRKARQLVRKKTGNYYRSIKRGKVWTDNSSGEYKVRVYSRSPHGHLLEYGHRIVAHDGTEHGYKEGYHVFERATTEIEKEWTNIVSTEFNRIMDKL